MSVAHSITIALYAREDGRWHAIVITDAHEDPVWAFGATEREATEAALAKHWARGSRDRT